MTFVTSGLVIAGVVSALIPILIHLLSRQRRRPIAWGAMRFLIEALRKHKRRLQLEQVLLLAVRCLLLLLLGIALARPILDVAGVGASGLSRAVFVLVDNGLTSALQDGSGRTTLDDSVDQAVGLIEALGPGDVVGVITAALPARGLVVPPSSDHRAIIEVLRSLRPTEAPTDFASAMLQLRSALDELGPDRDRAVVYLLSEFRHGAASLDVSLPSALNGLGSRVTLQAAAAAQRMVPNVQVTEIDPLRGLILSKAHQGSSQVTVRLARSASELGRGVTQVRLLGDDLTPIEPKIVQWEPGQAQASVGFVVDLPVHTDGALALRVSIDDDALGPDNRRHTVLASRSQVRVLLIDRRNFGADPDLDRLEAGQWIRRALQPSDLSPMDVVEVDPAALDEVDLRGVDAALLPRPDLLTDRGWSALQAFVYARGLLMVMPPAQSNVHQWTDELTRSMHLPWRIMLEVVEHESGLAVADEQPASELLNLLSGDLPELVRPVLAYRVLPVDVQQTQARGILEFADGSPLLIVGRPGRSGAAQPTGSSAGGLVVYLAVSPQLAWTNLPAKPLMVPLFHELIRQGVGVIQTSQHYGVGEQPSLGLGATAATLVGPNGKTISIDPNTGRPQQPLHRSGLYSVFDRAMRQVGTVAVNVDPASGRTDPQNQAAVLEWLEKSGPWEIFDAADPAAALRAAESGSSLAGTLLLAVLALIVVETALARWFSHAQTRGHSAAGTLATGLAANPPEPASAAQGT